MTHLWWHTPHAGAGGGSSVRHVLWTHDSHVWDNKQFPGPVTPACESLKGYKQSHLSSQQLTDSSFDSNNAIHQTLSLTFRVWTGFLMILYWHEAAPDAGCGVLTYWWWQTRREGECKGRRGGLALISYLSIASTRKEEGNGEAEINMFWAKLYCVTQADQTPWHEGQKIKTRGFWINVL